MSVKKFDPQDFMAEMKSLDPKNPGSWPFLPKIASLISISCIVCVAGWIALISDQLVLSDKYDAELNGLKKDFIDKKTQAVNLDAYKTQLNEIDKSFGQLLKQLPSASEVENLLVEVNQAGLGHGLQFELFKPANEVIKDFYAELPVAIKVRGSYHDLGKFASDIGKLSRIVTLNNIVLSLDVKDPKDAKNQSKEIGKEGRMTLEATLKTFRYLDESEVAAQQKAKDDAKKTKGKNDNKGAKK